MSGSPRGEEGPARLKVAVAVVVALTVTAHEPVPEQAPVQPAKTDPAAGVAVRVSAVPRAKDREQVAPQLIPAGALATVPAPDPLLVTDSVTVVPPVPVPDPLTAREIVSASAVKFTLPAKVPLTVGWKRTVTVWLLPAPREKGLPERTL
jgi:hypothetical protein